VQIPLTLEKTINFLTIEDENKLTDRNQFILGEKYQINNISYDQKSLERFDSSLKITAKSWKEMTFLR
jgi:hypothetical protein